MSVIDLPSRAEVMAALGEARLRQRRAEIDQVALIATAADAYGWVDVDPATAAEAPSVLHGERLLRMGAEGTPEVAEFICLEVGPALRMSPDAARCLIRDVLNLRHRLPLLWAAVLDDGIEVKIARAVARKTGELGVEPCRWVDSMLAPLVAQRASSWKIITTVEDLVLRADAELAEQKRQEKLRSRHVDLAPVDDADGVSSGVTDLFARLETCDAVRLNGTLDALADRLDPETGRDERRARALGLLADPHSASRLLSDAPPDEPEQVAPATQVVPVTTVNLVVHLRPTDLTGTENHPSGGVWEKHGPQTRAALTELLGNPATTMVRVQPVIDLNEPIAVTTYRPTERLGHAVRLRDGGEVFPWSSRRAATAAPDGLDLDHSTPWPHGTTRLDNLGLLSRRSHRAVTHGGFSVEQVRSGVFRWRTPAGQTWWTTPHGTSDRPPPEPGQLYAAAPDLGRVSTATSLRVAGLLGVDPPEAVARTTRAAHEHAWSTTAEPGGRPRTPPAPPTDATPPPF